MAPSACRLPIELSDGPQAGRPGFVNYPAGTFTLDPAGSPGGAPDWSTGKTYDWKFSRWVPARYELMSPDGAHYAYTETIPNPASQGLGGPPPLGSRVHLVDVATGKDAIVYQTRDLLFAVALKPEGIYLSQPSQYVDTAVPLYLWLLNPSTGSEQKLLGGKLVEPSFRAIGNGVLWTTVVDPSNPVGRGNSDNELVSLKLADGTPTAWFDQPKESIQLLGLDSDGHPVISIQDSGGSWQTVVVSAPNVTRRIANQYFSSMVTDSHGLWLSGPGVVLVRPDRSIQKFSTQSGWLLGPCG